MRAKLILTLCFAIVGVLGTYFLWDGRSPTSNSPLSAEPAEAHRRNDATSSTSDPATSLGRATNNSAATTATATLSSIRTLATSKDYFAVVKSMLPDAISGRARAQLLIAEALRRCRGMILLYRNAPDPRAALEQTLSTWKGAAQDLELGKNAQRIQFARCERFFVDDPFQGLPPRAAGSYDGDYWASEALKNGDPVALAQDARRRLTARSGEKSVSADSASSALAQFATAVASGDPDAIESTASAFQDQSINSSATLQVALMLVACDHGLDCRLGAGQLFGLDCGTSGACSEGDVYGDWAQRNIGSAAYAQAYALAQQLNTAIEGKNLSELTRLLSVGRKS